MADALTQNVGLANALASFSKTLFGSAPSTVTETGGGSTVTKGTKLSAEAISAMLREMTEGGLSGNGANGIAGLAAIMGGQKAAGLYNSYTTTQLMNKNAANIAERAALASANTTTTTTPSTAKRITEAPGLLSTQAGQTGLLLAGATLLKNKKFKKMIGMDDLSSIEEPVTNQSIEGFNQSVVADSVDYGGAAISESIASGSDIVDTVSNFGFETADSILDFNALGGLGNEFVSSAFETGATAAVDVASNAVDVSDAFDFLDIFADGGLVGRENKKKSKIPGYADGGIFNARESEKKKPGITTTGPLALAPIVNALTGGSRQKYLDGDEYYDGSGGDAAPAPANAPAGSNAMGSMALSIPGMIGKGIVAILSEVIAGVQPTNMAGVNVGQLSDNIEGEDAATGVNMAAMGAGAQASEAANAAVAGIAGIGVGEGVGPAGGVSGAADGDAGDAGWANGGRIPADSNDTGIEDDKIIRVSGGEVIAPADTAKAIIRPRDIGKGMTLQDIILQAIEQYHVPAAKQRRMQ